MTILRHLKLILTFGSVATAAVVRVDKGAAVGSNDDNSTDTPLPVVIWHGLGDNYGNEGLQAVGALLDSVNPGTLVYYVRLGDSPSADQSATFLGDVNEQVARVCHELATHPILSTAPAIDAVGFSQGGQFLRAYVERCNAPPVRNLVTFGAQHNGITRFRVCAPRDLVCAGAMWLLRAGVWTQAVQSRLVPAQYFRNPADAADLDKYLEHSNFLADANNERPLKNQTYRDNLASLANLVMYMFESDTTVAPKETAWFGEVIDDVVVPLQQRPLYTEDWIGLKALDDKGGLHFRTAPGDHMELTEELLNKTFGEFFGPWKKSTGGTARPVRVDLENGDL